MRGVFNGYSINGASIPDWLRRATVVAAAAASVTIAPTRTTFASAYGDASVVVTLTGNQNVAARATGSTDSSAYAHGNVIYSGGASTLADAVGYASVLRTVSAEADGDGTATGIANPADALGESTADASSTVILCEAHRIRPGASLQLATLTATQPAGDVTRYVLVDAVAGSPIGRAEASRKASGDSFFSHDGYVDGTVGSGSGFIEQEKAIVASTLGSFQYGDSTGSLSGFLYRPGASLQTGYAEGVATILLTRGGRSIAMAECDAIVAATRIANASVSGQATASLIAATSATRLLAHAVSSSDAGSLTAAAVRTCFSSFLPAYASASSEAAAATIVKYAESTASIQTSVGLAFATSNADVLADETRRMSVAYEPRGLIVPYHDRMITA